MTNTAPTPTQQNVLDAARDLTLADDVPAYRQVTAWLRRLRDSGEVAVGERLPSERRLADAIGISRMTLRQALDEMQRTGEIARTRGTYGGVTLRPRESSVNIADLVGLSPQLLRSASSVTSRVIRAVTEPADAAVAEELGRAEGDPVHNIMRVRFADETAVVLERSAFAADVLPGLLERDLTGSLYAILREEYGIHLAYASQEIEPLRLRPRDAELLGAGVGTAALGVARTTSTGSGERIEFSRDVFRTDQLRITVAGRIQPDPPAEALRSNGGRSI